MTFHLNQWVYSRLLTNASSKTLALYKSCTYLLTYHVTGNSVGRKKNGIKTRRLRKLVKAMSKTGVIFNGNEVCTWRLRTLRIQSSNSTSTRVVIENHTNLFVTVISSTISSTGTVCAWSSWHLLWCLPVTNVGC